MAGLGQHQVDRGIAALDEVLTGLGEVSLLGLDAEATGVSLVALAPTATTPPPTTASSSPDARKSSQHR